MLLLFLFAIQAIKTIEIPSTIILRQQHENKNQHHKLIRRWFVDNQNQSLTAAVNMKSMET